ncbi:hypothetical protein Tco_1564531, partial [Tanacetum coccineum]
KLNLTKPELIIPGIHKKLPYTMISDPKGVVYTNKIGGKRFMAFDEVYKFGNGTLGKVSEELQVILRDKKLGYNHGWLEDRVWTIKDVRRTKRMRNDIERTLKARRHMRRLESYVGGRPKIGDLRTFVMPE